MNAHRKKWALLIDPDKPPQDLKGLVKRAEEADVGYFLVGGSLLVKGDADHLVQSLKEITGKPIVIFPGSPGQVSGKADAIMFLSLISGRNPDLLIGRHVEAAPYIQKLGVETMPTGYMLVDCGTLTTAHYISHTFPLPYDKPELAAATALAGAMLGLKLLYLDGGSAASRIVNPLMVKQVKEATGLPLLVGGGIRNAEHVTGLLEAGADILVVGTWAEKEHEALYEIGKSIRCNNGG